MLRFTIITLLLLMLSFRANAQFGPISCPARILAVEPNAKCVARNNFTYLIFGTRKISTPSEGCKAVEDLVLNIANVRVSCQFIASESHCSCQSNGGQHRIDHVKIDTASLNPTCPPEHEILDERTLLTDAEGISVAVKICKPKITCPVAPLKPIVDPIAKEHEFGRYDGNPDIKNIQDSTRTGANCILKAIIGSEITSGLRPQSYQDHLREVWDKWELLKRDRSVACADIKRDIKTDFDNHGIVRRPGITSNHSTGKAVDIGRVPEAVADAAAKNCNMFRPYADDPVHFQPIEKPLKK